MSEQQFYDCPICGRDTPLDEPRCAKCQALPPIPGLSRRASNCLRHAGMSSKEEFVRFWTQPQTRQYQSVSYQAPPLQALLKYRGMGKVTINELLVWAGFRPFDRQAALDRPPFLIKDAPKLYSELLNAVGVPSNGETRHQTILRYIKEAEMRQNAEAKA